MRFNSFMKVSVAPLFIVVLIVSQSLSVAAQKPCKDSIPRYKNIEGRAITMVEASYPNERGMRVKGAVVVLVKVDPRGNVISAKAICGHPLLMASSVASAMKWKFQPRRVNGRLSNDVGIIIFDFTPDDARSRRSERTRS